MNALEDTVRAALRETAAEIHPQQVPPLRLPGPRSRWLRLPWRRRWPEWMAPVAAGVSVAAVVAGSIWLAAVTTRREAAPATGRPAAARGGTVRLGVAPAAADGLPAYDVALAPGPLAGASASAVVRATATGTILATIRPPAPFHEFTWVSGAADDREFVLAAHSPLGPRPPASREPGGRGATKFFLLRLRPAAGTARLTPLPIPEVPDLPGAGSAIGGIAVSPDASRLAVDTSAGSTDTLTVYRLATGSGLTWKGPARGARVAADELGANPLSWMADSQTLAFDVWNHSDIDVRLLDTARPGGNLWSSTKIMTFRNWPAGSVAGSAIISPDGTKVIAMAVRGGGGGAGQILANEFSARTGAPAGMLERLSYGAGQITGWPNVLWSNSTGSTLIVSVTSPDARPRNHGGLTAEAVGVVTRNTFTPLPGIPGGEKPAW